MYKIKRKELRLIKNAIGRTFRRHITKSNSVLYKIIGYSLDNEFVLSVNQLNYLSFESEATKHNEKKIYKDKINRLHHYRIELVSALDSKKSKEYQWEN